MWAFRISSRLWQVILVLAAGIAIMLALNWTRPEPERRAADGAVVPVEVIEAKGLPVRLNVTGHGTAQAKTSLKLLAQVPGEIVFLSPNMRAGRFVRRGETLIRIDPRAYELAVQRLKAQVRQGEIDLQRLQLEKRNAEADLELAMTETGLAERDLERERELVKRKTHSDASLDRAETAWVTSRKKARTVENQLALWPSNYAAAEARLEQLRAQLGEARLNLDHSEVLSPFDARVLARLVEVGQYAGTGTPLGEIYDPSVMEIPLDIPLEDFQWLDAASLPAARTGQAAAGKAARAEACLSVGRNRYAWQGVVARVEGQIERSTRTVGMIVEVRNDVAASASNGNVTLLPGTFLEVEIEGKLVENVVTVPRGAIDQNDMVYISNAGQLAFRRVSVLRISGSSAYLDSGVRPGDLVIVSPLAAMVEGMALRPILKAESEHGRVAGTADRGQP